jgi:hypothetical protein
MDKADYSRAYYDNNKDKFKQRYERKKYEKKANENLYVLYNNDERKYYEYYYKQVFCKLPNEY